MELKKIIQQLAQTGEEKYAKICEVVAVNSEEKTADLQPIDGTSPIYDAFLQVDDNGVFIEPKTGSLVCVVFISKEQAMVVNHSEIQQFFVKVEGVEFKIDKNGFLLKKNKIVFKNLLNELLNELKNAIIQTPSGVGNFSPNNKMKFEQINEKINQLFSD